MKFEVGERVQFVFNGKLVGLGVITEMGENTCIVESEGNQRSYLLGKSEIAKLDQPEPVKVPKFVADLINGYEKHLTKKGRECSKAEVLAEILDDLTNIMQEDFDEAGWIDSNLSKFIEAVMFGCVVEEEKKYYVKLLAMEEGYLALNTQPGNEYYTISSPYEVEGLKTKFTETEIKAIDERLWAFAVPVEEVEAE